MATVFRRMIEFDRRMNDGSLSEESMSLYKEVKQYILSGVYTIYTKKEVLLKYYSHSDAVLASKLGVSEDAVRKIKSRVSGEVYKLLGKDVFDDLISNDEKLLKKVRLTLNICKSNYSSSTMFSSELVSMIRNASLDDKSFGIGDCIPELTFLYWMSNSRVAEMLSNVDADRLNYLLKVIDGEVGGASLRNGVIDVICSNDLASAVPKSKLSETAFPPVRSEVLL